MTLNDHAECHYILNAIYAECHFANVKCHYAECPGVLQTSMKAPFVICLQSSYVLACINCFHYKVRA
jgi:hypothetical protein